MGDTLYDLGDVATISAEFKNGAGAFTDPASLSVEVRKPTGTLVTYTYPTSPEVIKDAVGKYHVDVACDTAGQWRSEWRAATGVVTDPVQQGDFQVRERVSATEALTTVGAVRVHLQKQGTDVAQDPLIAAAIARASRAIRDKCGREFVGPQGTVARKFAYRGRAVLWAPYDLRAVTSVTVDTDLPAADQTVLTTDDWRLHPRTPREVYEWMQLAPEYAARSGEERELTINGTWGYAKVPESVELACILTVTDWLRRHVSAFSTTFEPEEEDGGRARPLPLPGDAYGLIVPYMRRTAG